MIKKFTKFLVLACFVVLINDFVVNLSTNQLIYDELTIPKNDVGVILGTSKYTIDGKINLFYKNRIDAAVSLFENGKIDKLIVSGDHSTPEYNEPQTMLEDLVSLGVPEDKIFLDYAGLSTLDSVIRANKIFELDKFTIISQEFQNQRALFITKYNKIDAIAYNAKDVPFKFAPRIYVREKFARIKTLIDLVNGSQPKYLGETIEI